MAVPASGELKLWDTLWNQELAGTKGENSLHSASVYAGFSTPDALSDFYGWSDVELPSVTSLSAQSVTHNSAVLRGCVTDTGNEDVSSGFYIGTSPSSTSNPKVTLPGTRGLGIYCCSKTGLSGQTSYKSWAFACNSAGECIANSCCTFTTPAPPFTPSQRHWYCRSVANLGDLQYQTCPQRTIASHFAGAYAQNPYTNSYTEMWTYGPIGCGNDCTPATCYGASNANNKWCHKGNYTTRFGKRSNSAVRSTATQFWTSVFPNCAPSVPPGSCGYSPGVVGSNVDFVVNNQRVQFGSRQHYDNSAFPCNGNFAGFFCFPAIP